MFFQQGLGTAIQNETAKIVSIQEKIEGWIVSARLQCSFVCHISHLIMFVKVNNKSFALRFCFYKKTSGIT